MNANNSGNSQCSHAQSSSSGSRRSGEQQHNYVNQPPLVAHHHHHHHHSKDGSGHGKHRRSGQKRVTHNEKRYHSGTIDDDEDYFL